MNDNLLSNFGSDLQVAVIGASGGIGRAFVEQLQAQNNVSEIHAFSRSNVAFNNDKVTPHTIDIVSESSIKQAVDELDAGLLFDVIIVAVGLLHDDTLFPEKSIRDVSLENFQRIFAVNSFGPMLLAKHFLPRLVKDSKSVFACLSARVGSISDNHLGGWYAYRASKAALNMIIKNTAIEMSRRYKQSCIIGLHPGTVDTALSQPFKKNVSDQKLFTPEYSSECLLKVINNTTPNQSGTVIAWDGKEVLA